LISLFLGHLLLTLIIVTSECNYSRIPSPPFDTPSYLSFTVCNASAAPSWVFFILYHHHFYFFFLPFFFLFYGWLILQGVQRCMYSYIPCVLFRFCFCCGSRVTSQNKGNDDFQDNARQNQVFTFCLPALRYEGSWYLIFKYASQPGGCLWSVVRKVNFGLNYHNSTVLTKSYTLTKFIKLATLVINFLF